jgi:hypothetical protein
MTSPRTLTAIASAAAALFTVAGAQASTLYDAGLLSFESTAQSMWGSGEAFPKADSVFVGAEWSNAKASFNNIVGDPNKIVTPAYKQTRTDLWDAWEALRCNGAFCIPRSAYPIPEPPRSYTIDIPAVTRDARIGAKVDVTSSGKVGLNFGYAIDSGSVDATALFRATAQLPDLVKPTEFFSIQAGSVFDRGTISTQSPKIEAYISPVLKLSASVSGQVCGNALGCSTPRSVTLPSINLENQRLLSIDPNSLKILDGILPDGKPLAEVPIANQTLTLEGGVTTSKPPVVGFSLKGPSGVTIATNLPPGVPTVTAKGATVAAFVPNIATRGESMNAPVESSGRSDLLTAKIDLDAVAAGRGLIPPTGASYDIINTGGFKIGVSGDLIDAEAGPVLGVTQNFTFRPTLMATLNFSRPVQIAGLHGPQDTWTGQWSNLPSFAIDGTTTFTPTFWLDAMLTNEFGLDLGLIGTYDVLKLSVTAQAGPFEVLKINPVSMNRALGLGNTMFETDKISFSVYDDTFDLEGFQAIAGQSFTIAVPEPSTYAMLLLGLGALGATARRRAREQQDSVNTPQR